MICLIPYQKAHFWTTPVSVLRRRMRRRRRSRKPGRSAANGDSICWRATEIITGWWFQTFFFHKCDNPSH
jgi:hypothetical protein